MFDFFWYFSRRRWSAKNAGDRQTNINCNCKWCEMSEWLTEWMNGGMNGCLAAARATEWLNGWHSSGAASGSSSTENCVKWMSSLASDNFDELNKNTWQRWRLRGGFGERLGLEIGGWGLGVEQRDGHAINEIMTLNWTQNVQRESKNSPGKYSWGRNGLGLEPGTGNWELRMGMGVSLSKASPAAASSSPHEPSHLTREWTAISRLGGFSKKGTVGMALDLDGDWDWHWNWESLDYNWRGSNKSHDRHGHTETLFLGLPSHGNGPRPPCERKVRIKKLAYTQYPLPGTSASASTITIAHTRTHQAASWSCQMGAAGAARKLPAAAADAAHFNLII